jgi:hypothetical protein
VVGGVHASYVVLEDHSENPFFAAVVLGWPLESVQLPWVVRTKDPLWESRIPGHNVGSAGELPSL